MMSRITETTMELGLESSLRPGGPSEEARSGRVVVYHHSTRRRSGGKVGCPLLFPLLCPQIRLGPCRQRGSCSLWTQSLTNRSGDTPVKSCQAHGQQPIIHVSPDVAKSVFDRSYDLPIRRIDVYVDDRASFEFFLSRAYCQQVGLPATGLEIRQFTDDKTFEAALDWNPPTLPCCGKCFYDRYPNALSVSSESPPAAMGNGYVISDLK